MHQSHRVHHVALHGVEAAELAADGVVAARAHRHMPVLHLGALHLGERLAISVVCTNLIDAPCKAGG